ncbi:MAG TPA: CHRD domain-containing protein [Vicinamibacterales bacterium]|nr:CHRD domain-containing protein [Vicinamibacterales bacterium]
MMRFGLTAAAAAIALALPVSAVAQTTQYKTRLAMVPTDLAMQATISGLGSATATLKGTTLTITGTFSGLKTPATVARVHRSAKPGMRGAPIADLTVTTETAGSIGGVIELTKEQIADLAAGRLYIQLHSQKAPDGNLWGWLFAAEGKK